MTTKQRSNMTKIGLLFLVILGWSIITTTLLVRQFHRNSELEHKLSTSSTTDNTDGRKGKKQHKMRKQSKVRRKDDQRKQQQQPPASSSATDGKIQFSLSNTSNTRTNDFPFTRSLKTFKTSQSFFIYIVQSNEKQQQLEWSEVRWKDLVLNWDRDSTFENLIGLSTPLDDTATTTLNKRNQQERQIQLLQKKLVIHCLPKTASTTLRKACKGVIDKQCEDAQLPQRQDPYGYRDAKDFYHAVNVCRDVDHFCVQGGDINMNVINYDNTDGYDEDASNKNDANTMDPHHFVHLVPFRNFNDWAASALKQIYVIDGNCDRIKEGLEQCLGYRELYMELYPKAVLSLLIGMAFRGNGMNDDESVWRQHEHHIVLYNYKDTDTIVTELSNFFDIEPMPQTDQKFKEVRDEGTCPNDVLERFHECHDETMKNMDAIRNFESENKRRRKDMVKMKQIISRARKRERGELDDDNKDGEDGDDES